MLLRQHGRSLVVRTPAKLNLFLEILGRRHDGFHELETLMVTVGIHDTLTFTEEVSGEIRLRCFWSTSPETSAGAVDSDVPDGRQNLVFRAAELLQNHAGVARGVRIELNKRIPVAAGLAGGSSDAAATLMALNRLWQVGLTTAELQRLASQLGSDVGFFLGDTSAAICRGRGERVEPLALPLGLQFVIARPAGGLSTALVYRHCRPAEEPTNCSRLVEYLKQGRLGDAGRQFYNALQEPAEQLNPDVMVLKTFFSNQPVLGHLMSGSGSAYFGLCANRRQAHSVAARLRGEMGCRVYVAQSGP